MIAKRLFLPGVLLAILALLALNLTNSPSGAAPPPATIDLVGTYDVAVEGIGSEPGSYHEPFVYSTTMTVTGQEGRLFWGELGNSDGTADPMDGAMMSSEGSSTAVCITSPYVGGYGSIAVVAGRGGRPPQVTMEALATSVGSDSFSWWAAGGHMVATKRQGNYVGPQ
jgi:hypothetical protein